MLRFPGAMDGSGKNLHISGYSPARRQHGGTAGGTHPAFAHGASAAVTAEIAPSHFTARVWSLSSEAAAACNHLIVLTTGTAEIAGRQFETKPLVGPMIAWLPAGSADQIEVGAGATSSVLRLRESVWHRYVAPSAEPAYLDLTRAREILTLPLDGGLSSTLAGSIAAIATELAAPARAGAVSIISAELTLCLLRLWRLITRDDTQGEGNTTEILSRFRRLVEEHYHHQLRVGDFASLLGVSPDRLHALCTRALDRSPSALIQQRVVQEAVLRLETSGATVKQIAFALGFKDTAYFSRFFSKHTGRSPRAWRRTFTARGEAGRTKLPSLNFADWP